MFDKKKFVIVFSGVSLDHTPVVKEFLEHSKSLYKIKSIEYIHKKRMYFILKALSTSIINIRAKMIFIGIQCYPLMSIISWLKKEIIYWSLEAYSGNEDKSLAAKLNTLKKYINWKRTRIIIPIEERKEFYTKFKYKSLSIFPNTPRKGIPFTRRQIDRKEIKFVFYGNLDDNYVYISNWIKFIKNNYNYKLTLIGRNFDYSDEIKRIKNLTYLGILEHNSLLKELKLQNFSIVGYKPINLNNKFCAPNKLFESYSLSLPVIVNKNNPTLKRIVENYGGGIIIDFSNIPSDLLSEIKVDEYYKMNENAYKIYQNTFNFDNFINELNFI